MGYRQRAKIYLSRGRFNEAVHDLRKVVNLKASDKEGVFDRDVTWAMFQAIVHGKYKEAVIALGPLIMQCQTDPDVSGIYKLEDLHLLKGVSQWFRGYYAKAREDFNEAYQTSAEGERSLHLCYALMVSHLQENEMTLALEYLEEALRAAPSLSLIHI